MHVPGASRASKRQASGTVRGIYTAGRRAWIAIKNYEFITYVRNPQAEARFASEPGQDVEMLICITNYKPIRIVLSEFTVEELRALKHYMDVTFQAAFDSSERRDKHAEASAAAGMMTHARIFRNPPTVWIRDRTGIEPEDMPQELDDSHRGSGAIYERRVVAGPTPLNVGPPPVEAEDDESRYGVTDSINLDE